MSKVIFVTPETLGVYIINFPSQLTLQRTSQGFAVMWFCRKFYFKLQYCGFTKPRVCSI